MRLFEGQHNAGTTLCSCLLQKETLFQLWGTGACFVSGAIWHPMELRAPSRLFLSTSAICYFHDAVCSPGLFIHELVNVYAERATNIYS